MQQKCSCICNQMSITESLDSYSSQTAADYPFPLLRVSTLASHVSVEIKTLCVGKNSLKEIWHQGLSDSTQSFYDITTWHLKASAGMTWVTSQLWVIESHKFYLVKVKGIWLTLGVRWSEMCFCWQFLRWTCTKLQMDFWTLHLAHHIFPNDCLKEFKA